MNQQVTIITVHEIDPTEHESVSNVTIADKKKVDEKKVAERQIDDMYTPYRLDFISHMVLIITKKCSYSYHAQ